MKDNWELCSQMEVSYSMVDQTFFWKKLLYEKLFRTKKSQQCKGMKIWYQFSVPMHQIILYPMIFYEC